MDPEVRPLTRSSIKPRVLFRDAAVSGDSGHNGGASLTDEEAATDIEEQEDEPVEGLESDHDPAHANPDVKSSVTTPAAPGASGRPKRTHNVRQLLDSEATPSETSQTQKEKRISPFDGWMRKKQNQSPTRSMSKASSKRDGDGDDASRPIKKPKGR
jgi:hypothetical protein